MPDLPANIEDLGLISFLILMSAARMLGFLAGFTLVNFALHRGALVRMALAIAIGLPVGIANLADLNDVYDANSLVDRAFLPVKELLLGFVIAKVASLPFYAFVFAGTMCDGFRGESSNTLPLEGSSMVTTGAMLFYLVFAFSFFVDDGLWKLIEVVYGTYLIWPVTEFLPTLSGSAARVLVEQIHSVFVLMVRVGLPLLFVFLVIEISLMMASRVGRRFALHNYSFMVKNMVFLAFIPLYLVYVSRVAMEHSDTVLSAPFILRLVLE